MRACVLVSSTTQVGEEQTDDFTPLGGVNVLVHRDRDGHANQSAAMQPHLQQVEMDASVLLS